MSARTARTIGGATLAAAALGVGMLTGGVADAASLPVTHSSVYLHLDLQAGQTPENIVLDRNHSVDVTFAKARQVARITADKKTHVLATLPAPADPTARTPLLGFPLTAGLVRVGDRFWVLYDTGSNAETGVWTFDEGQDPHKFADLPSDGFPNGMAMDRRSGTLYITDSAKGVVYAVATTGRAKGRTTLFSDSKALASNGFFGVNGAKIHEGDLYVSNTDRGTVLRAPLTGPSTGVFTTFDTGLAGIDDFVFTGKGNAFLASIVTQNTVVLADGKGAHQTVLTADDGLSNPTSVAIRGNTMYVPSAAYITQNDPNLLVAQLVGH